MCVFLDVVLNGLLERDKLSSLVKPDSTAISDIWLLERNNSVRLVKVDSAEISEIWLL